MHKFFSAFKKLIYRRMAHHPQDFIIFEFHIGSDEKMQQLNRAFTPACRSLKDFSYVMYYPDEGNRVPPRYCLTVSTYPSCYNEFGRDLKTHNFESSQSCCYKDSRLPFFNDANLIILGVEDFEIARTILLQMMAVRTKYNKSTDVPVIIINCSTSEMPADLPGNIIQCLNDFALPEPDNLIYYDHYKFIHGLATDCFKMFLAHEVANRQTCVTIHH